MMCLALMPPNFAGRPDMTAAGARGIVLHVAGSVAAERARDSSL